VMAMGSQLTRYSRESGELRAEGAKPFASP
jgi:hypothetical protein